ncbi:hypothetical protein IP87_12840 [beta proteobacterium AAP121]|nr:hypothetical protein IP80_12560 [beta proteobacterium AAP65]KPF97012.1 hypothetical protein IP87_12840 [beta proteobacterium AAP121]
MLRRLSFTTSGLLASPEGPAMRTALTFAALALALATSAQAQTLQYSFSTTVHSVGAGAPVSGTVSFDLAATSAAPTNLNIGGVIINSFDGTV